MSMRDVLDEFAAASRPSRVLISVCFLQRVVHDCVLLDCRS